MYGVSSIHENRGRGNIQNKLRTNPTRRPHSHPGSHPASSAPSETGAGKNIYISILQYICTQKTDLLGVYNVCFLRFLCFLFSLCLQNRCRNQKKCPSHVISRILHSVGFLFGRFQCFGILFGRSFW